MKSYNPFENALDGLTGKDSTKTKENTTMGINFKDLDTEFLTPFSEGFYIDILNDYRDINVEVEDWAFDGEDEVPITEVRTHRFYSTNYENDRLYIHLVWDDYSNEKEIKFYFEFNDIDDTIYKGSVSSTLETLVNSIGGYLSVTHTLGRKIEKITFKDNVIVPSKDKTGYIWENKSNDIKSKGDTLIGVIWEHVFEENMKEIFTIYLK